MEAHPPPTKVQRALRAAWRSLDVLSLVVVGIASFIAGLPAMYDLSQWVGINAPGGPLEHSAWWTAPVILDVGLIGFSVNSTKQRMAGERAGLSTFGMALLTAASMCAQWLHAPTTIGKWYGMLFPATVFLITHSLLHRDQRRKQREAEAAAESLRKAQRAESRAAQAMERARTAQPTPTAVSPPPAPALSAGPAAPAAKKVSESPRPVKQPAREDDRATRDARIHELRAAGKSTRQIGLEVGCSEATVRNVLGKVPAGVAA